MTADHCDASQGVLSVAASTSGVPSYTESGFRTCIVMQCATSHRPFNFMKDKWYQTSIEMLRLGIHIPDPTTVSRDAKNLYLDVSDRVKDYFVVCGP
ncbi:hypothetical protein C8R44DRAFT_638520 [Mycena epipterygia]|nr:hypothetical protein C8R44DRAFT_638520 [Mycena epipterygia]